jgi:hypothetical protein
MKINLGIETAIVHLFLYNQNMYNSSTSRQEFIGSRFLTIKLIDLEKSLLHRNVEIGPTTEVRF